ncbi:MAG: hypothetical protein OEY23_19230 [Acidimicrobiia bacterium]|nr:hypothetical protein [Acidimicrobiia bacterium]
MRRWVPHLVTLGALALALSPLLGRADRQSVPLSTYPMYAADRGPIVAFPTVRAWPAGTTSGPDRVPIGVLGTDDPLVAVTRLNQAISAGRDRDGIDLPGRAGRVRPRHGSRRAGHRTP